jgi:hypothetical protein
MELEKVEVDVTAPTMGSGKYVFVAPSSPAPPRPKSPKPGTMKKQLSTPTLAKADPVPAQVVAVDSAKKEQVPTKHKHVFAFFSSKELVNPVAFVVQSLLERISDPSIGVPRRINRFGLAAYPNSFIGKDCVSWLVKNKFCDNATSGEKLLAALIADDVVVEVQRDLVNVQSICKFRSEITSHQNPGVFETSLQNLSLKLSPRPNRKMLYKGPPVELFDWVCLSPDVHTSSALEHYSFDPLTCLHCGCQKWNGTKQCEECATYYFRNANGKPLKLMIRLLKGYHYELGCRPMCAKMSPLDNELQVDDWRVDYPIYGELLVQSPHDIFVGDPEEGALVCICEKFDNLEANKTARVVIFTEKGTRVACAVGTDTRDVSDRIRIVSKLCQSAKPLRLAKQAKNEMLEFESKMAIRTYKFGLLLMKEGQTTETDLYSNVAGSKHYDDFLSIFTKVELAGFPGFRGGLECKGNNSTGLNYYYYYYYYLFCFFFLVFFLMCD